MSNQISYPLIYLLAIPASVLAANLAEAKPQYIPIVDTVFSVATYSSLFLIFVISVIILKVLLFGRNVANEEGSVELFGQVFTSESFIVLATNLYLITILSSVAGIIGSFCLM